MLLFPKFNYLWTIHGRIIKTVSLSLLFVTVSWASDSDYETEYVFKAADIFEGVDLSTDLYEVQEEVTTDGFLTRTLVDAEYGTFEAVGPDMLAVRLHEIGAIRELIKLEDSDEFTEGAKDSADDKIDAVKQMIDKPKETFDGLEEGVSRFFKRAYRAGKTGIQKAGDVLNDQTPGVQEGSGSKLPGAKKEEMVTEQESKYAVAARTSGRTAANILGFDDARRKLAKRLSVDPYTTNSILNQKIDEVAMTIFAGDLAVDVATSLIPGSFLISTTSVATNWVWDTPPGDLRVAIEERLEGMNIPEEDIDNLLRHKWYPLSYQAVLSDTVSSLAGIGDLSSIMPVALSVTSYDQARFVISTLRMLAAYHQDVSPLVSIDAVATLVGVDQQDRVIITAPADRIVWNPGLDWLLDQTFLTERKTRFYAAGFVSERAVDQLSGAGWEVQAQSELYRSLVGDFK